MPVNKFLYNSCFLRTVGVNIDLLFDRMDDRFTEGFFIVRDIRNTDINVCISDNNITVATAISLSMIKDRFIRDVIFSSAFAYILQNPHEVSTFLTALKNAAEKSNIDLSKYI